MNEWIFIKARRQPKWAVSFYGHWHRPSRWLDIFLQPNLQIKRSIQIELLLTQIYLPKSTNISVIVLWQVRYDLKQIIFNYFRTKLIFASTPQIMHQNISEISLIVLVPENPGFDPYFCHKMIHNCSVLFPTLALKQCYALGWSPGLVVMGDDSCSKGCGFESRRHLLDGHLYIVSHYLLQKLKCLFENTENKRKEARVGLI